MSDVEQWEHDEQRAMENEIISLREQVEFWQKEAAGRRDDMANYTRIVSETIDRLNVEVSKLTKERKDAERFRDGWTHSCNALCMEIELWIDRCPHCGRPAPKAPTMQEDKP